MKNSIVVLSIMKLITSSDVREVTDEQRWQLKMIMEV